MGTFRHRLSLGLAMTRRVGVAFSGSSVTVWRVRAATFFTPISGHSTLRMMHSRVTAVISLTIMCSDIRTGRRLPRTQAMTDV